MTRKEAQRKVVREARKRALANGHTMPNMLDLVPVVVTPNQLATLRKAFGIKAA